MEVEKSCHENFQLKESTKNCEQLPPILQCSVENIAIKEGFVTHSVDSKKISTKGNNYMADLYVVDVKGKTKNGDKEINLFIKNSLSFSESISSFLSSKVSYMKECYAYKDLAQIMKQLQDEAGVPAEERYKMVKGYEESSSEAIIMENVAKKGYKTVDRMKIPPLKYIELSIKQLAKFHGLGFAKKELMPEYYEQKISKIEFHVKINEEWRKFYEILTAISTKNLRADYKKKAERFVFKAMELYPQFLNDRATIQTLCHGDYRTANIMAKEEEGKVTEIIPVDFQIIHYGCPVNDLLYFLFSCTDRQCRRQNFNYIIDLYYDALKSFLSYFKIDAAEVYPRKKFDEALKHREYYGLIIALGFYPVLLAPENNFLDFSDDEKPLELDLNPEIVGRIEEIIEDLDYLGLL